MGYRGGGRLKREPGATQAPGVGAVPALRSSHRRLDMRFEVKGLKELRDALDPKRYKKIATRGRSLQHYIDLYAKRSNNQVLGITDEVMQVLMNHPWFGNVRELQNLSEMFIVLSKMGGKIDIELLPRTFFDLDTNRTGITYYEAVRAFEKDFILKILNDTGWNRLFAAKRLGMHRNTLLNKIKELGIQETH